MPRAPRYPCRYRGCPALIEGGGYCEAHRSKRPRVAYAVDVERRGTASDRGYDATWRRVRAWVLNREPLCRHCYARHLIVPATLVDHIQPLRHGGTHRLANLQPLCIGCHAIKTADDMKRSGAATGEPSANR